MACYLKCDWVASYFKPTGQSVKCICDAGVFLDVETVTGAGNVMEARWAPYRPGRPRAARGHRLGAARAG